MDVPRDNPLALPGAPPPRIERVTVNGTMLYTETRGSGPPILLIPGGAEDAEGWRPVAERLIGHTVVTYDRRGGLRSGHDDWPGDGAAQHADDAQALLEALDLQEVTVVGSSSAGVIALELAMRHPERLRRVLAYEPGYIAIAQGGRERQAMVRDMVQAHLEKHPDDWVGAYHAFVGQAQLSSADPAVSPGAAWFAQREDLSAEAFLRDDLSRIAGGDVDRAALAATPAEIRFAYGSDSARMFREIVTALAEARGVAPDVIDGVDHALYQHPAPASDYILEHAAGAARAERGH